METMKILYVSSCGIPTPAPAYSGLEQVCWNTAVGMKKLGHEVSIVASADSDKKAYDKAGISLIPTVFSSLTPIPESEMWSLAIGRIRDFNKYDLIHDMSHSGVAILGEMEAQKNATPFPPRIWTIHDDLPFSTHPPVPYPCIISPSLANSQGISERVPDMVTRVCWHGIDTELHKYSEDKGDRLLYVGRIDPIKSADMAINIADVTGHGLDIVGPIHIRNKYSEKILSLCDGKNIVYHGEVPHEKKVEFMQKAKALVTFPRFQEPFGLLSPEAQATGTPVISDCMGGLPETIKQGVTGFSCVTPGDAVQAIERIDSIRPKECRAWVEKHFTVEEMCGRYRKIYREVLERGVRW